MKRTVLIFLSLALAACAKESLQATYDKQTSYIEGFLSTQMQRDPTATLLIRDGVYRLNMHDTLDATLHRTDSLHVGGKVALYYGCFTLTGNTVSSSNLVATNLKELAIQAKWNLTDTTRYKLDTLRLGADLVPGLRNGLLGVQAGDQGYILFTGKYGYGNTERGTIPAKSALAYQIWIESVKNE